MSTSVALETNIYGPAEGLRAAQFARPATPSVIDDDTFAIDSQLDQPAFVVEQVVDHHKTMKVAAVRHQQVGIRQKAPVGRIDLRGDMFPWKERASCV